MPIYIYHSRIGIAAETTPRFQSNDISHIKRQYVMNPICERQVLQSQQGHFSKF